MIVTINGKETQLPEHAGRTVASLLTELEVAQPLYVTVELNGDIAERSDFATTPVAEGDVIEFLYFMGGGR